MATIVPKAVVFFMAHAGITQVLSWIQWRLSLPVPEHVAFRVFCPPSFVMPEPHFKRLPYYYETHWGSPSIIYAQMDGYAHILKEFPSVDMVFLVSGSCVPIASADTFLKILNLNKSHVPFTRSGNGGHANRKDKLYEVKPSFLKSLSLNVQPEHSTLQWLHLTRPHIQYLIAFPLWKMLSIHSTLEITYKLRGKKVPVPDEYWPWFILRNSGICYADIIDKTLTEQDREYSTSPSPITWHSLDLSRKVYDGYDTIKQEEIFSLVNLRSIVQECSSQGSLFYRKVGIGVNFLEFKP